MEKLSQLPNQVHHDICLEKACVKETRHKIDAEVVVNVTAHHLIVVKECPLHGDVKAGAFPDDIKATVQCGKNMVARCADSLALTYEKIRQIMVNLGLIHCDETGTRIDVKTWWVHNAFDMNFTFLSVDRKRGRIGMDAVCCAHLLRELNGVEENRPEQK